MHRDGLSLVLVPFVTGLFMCFLGLFSFTWWFSKDQLSASLSKHLPGADGVPKDIAQNRGKVKIGQFFKDFGQKLSSETVSENWPAFRGLAQSNIYQSDKGLIDSFSPTVPRKLWEIELGEGHAAPAIYGGCMYFLDYLEKESADCLRCFDLFTGKELWRRFYKVDIKRNHGRSRTIPAVNEDVVVTLGPKAHVMCVKRTDGSLLWVSDLVDEYGTTVPQWYAGQCPLIDGDKVILAPAGPKDLLLALSARTGEKIWSCPNEDDMTMSHSSIIKMNLLGEDLYVYAARGGIVGVSLAGKRRFVTTKWSPTVVAPSPVAVSDRSFFTCAGYGSGSVLVELSKGQEELKAKIVQRYKPREGFSLEQQSAIYVDGLLFGVLPKDAGSRRERLACCSPRDLSKILAQSKDKFGLGPFIYANGKFFVLSDDGELFIFRFENEKFTKLAAKKVLPGPDAWGPMALVDGYLILRDANRAICLDVANER